MIQNGGSRVARQQEIQNVADCITWLATTLRRVATALAIEQDVTFKQRRPLILGNKKELCYVGKEQTPS